MPTIKELEKQIAIEREKLNEAKKIDEAKLEKKKLSRELFNLKNRKAIGIAKTISDGLAKAGKVIAEKGAKLADKMEEANRNNQEKLKNIKGKKKKKEENVQSSMMQPTQDWGFKF